jgi:hypothetical protein
VFLGLVIVAAVLPNFKLLLIGSALFMLSAIPTALVGALGPRSKTRDECPKCGRCVIYYKADRSLTLACPQCGHTWAAGQHPRV